MNKNNPPKDEHSLTLQQSLDLAIQHHNVGDLPKAEGLYKRILQTEPNHPVALHLLGVIALQVDRIDIAVELITKAINIIPDYADAHSNLGNALQALKRFDEAVVHYHKAINIKPDYAEAHFNLGVSLKALERLDEAVVHFQKAVNINSHIAKKYNNLDNVLHNLGKKNKGISICETIDPQLHLTVDAAYYHAKDHFIDGRYSEADRICTAIILAVPEHVEALKLVGDIAQKIERHDLAVELYQRAIKCKNNLPILYFNLGNSLDQLGRNDMAVRVMQIGLEKDSNNKKISDYLNNRSTVFRTVNIGGETAKLTGADNINCFDDDLFSVCFPRSGSTWMRCLLSAIFNPKVDIKFTEIDKYCPVVHFFDNISLLRPFSPRWIHSYERYNPGYKRVVYFYRDVRYVIPSYHKHYKKQHDWDCDLDEFLDAFIKGEKTQLGINTGCWKTHVESWLDRPKAEGVITFKYEELRENTVKTIETFLTKIGHPKDKKLISKVVEQFSLKNMKKMEKNDKTTNLFKKNRQIPFIGGGQNQHWREMLEERHIERIKHHYNDLLVRLGYEKDDKW